MTKEKQPDGCSSEFSVIIGLVSTCDGERIFETLESLRHQQGSHDYEVIIADRCHNNVSARIDADYPEVQRISCAPEMSLPELRTQALGRASGAYIIITEDHCVPANNWLSSIREVFQESPVGTVAVGGCVENGVHASALDWATFFCEYSYFLEPVEEGVTSVLPGMNIAYHHSVFESYDARFLASGFWEICLHPLLISNGFKFYSSNKIRLYHCKKFSFPLFIRQRFLYSRYHAGMRFSRTRIGHRILACGASLLLPPWLLCRSFLQIRSKQRLRKEFRSALPILFVFYLVWAYGEMVGYALGKGSALNRIE